MKFTMSWRGNKQKKQRVRHKTKIRSPITFVSADVSVVFPNQVVNSLVKPPGKKPCRKCTAWGQAMKE